MSADPFGVARRLREWGSANPSFDALMLVGPVVLLAIVVGGRGLLTTAIAVGYLAAFVVALASNALTAGEGP